VREEKRAKKPGTVQAAALPRSNKNRLDPGGAAAGATPFGLIIPKKNDRWPAGRTRGPRSLIISLITAYAVNTTAANRQPSEHRCNPPAKCASNAGTQEASRFRLRSHCSSRGPPCELEMGGSPRSTAARPIVAWLPPSLPSTRPLECCFHA